MSNVHLSALLTVVVALSPTAAAAAIDKGDSCTLSETVKVSAKAKGKGKKKEISSGAEITVIKSKKGWLQIKAARTKGWIKGTKLESLCAAEAPVPKTPPQVDQATDDLAPSAGTGDDTGAPPWAASEPADRNAGLLADDVEDSDDAATDDDTDEDNPEEEPNDDDPSPPSDHALFQAGGGMVFGSEIGRPGLRGELFVDLGALLANLRGGGSLVFWLPEIGTVIALNADAHYLFDVAKNITVYPLAGLALVHARFELLGQTFSATNMGLNMGGGGEYDLDFAKVYVETKFVVIDGSQLVFSGGIRFGF